MKLCRYISTVFLAFCALLAGPSATAGQITVAVASDFSITMEALKKEFEFRTEHTVTIAPGTNAGLYANLISGADFDLFFSTDAARAQVLDQRQLIVPGTRFTFATSKLVLWSVDNRRLDEHTLADGDFALLAIANPRLDPFGEAARQVLEGLGLWEALQDKIVLGDNIGHAYHLAISGDVDLALVAFSQLVYGDYMQAGGFWQIPTHLYRPIEHQAVLLRDTPAARAFFNFVRSSQGRQVISSNGYDVP